ncbi:MAG: DciA family protein [Arcanobacterium sp.]|nr:DciA family protein [Arcanobacterium sp.]MDY5588741.1 DciA family protein [Arcanobacterium sp.]
MNSVHRAKIAAAERFGDMLPLQMLQRARVMAERQGWVRRRKESRVALSDLHAAGEQLGADVFVPVPGQEVGSGARPSWRDPHAIGVMVNATLQERGWLVALDVAAMANRWPEVAGPHVAQHSHVEEFSDDGVLTIQAHSVAWETQLRALSAVLDRRLAEVLGEGVVKELVIKGPHLRSWKHGKYSVPGRGPRDTYD